MPLQRKISRKLFDAEIFAKSFRDHPGGCLTAAQGEQKQSNNLMQGLRRLRGTPGCSPLTDTLINIQKAVEPASLVLMTDGADALRAPSLFHLLNNPLKNPTSKDNLGRL